jgi:hypothetical protein
MRELDHAQVQRFDILRLAWLQVRQSRRGRENLAW